jgi:3-dehydroquinate synthase
VIKDRKLFSYLEKNYKRALSLDENVLKHIISACSRIKARVVKEDELDKKGKRIILNFGHTVGHAIESACGYSGKYNHGEAVAIGMICASRISSKLGLIRRRDRSRIEDLIKKCALPATMSGLDIKRIQSAMLRDKKFIHGKNRFVLPVSIGKVKIVEGIKRSIIMDSIKECAR